MHVTTNESKKRAILCMFSGGLDSLGVLYRLLTDTKFDDYQIHVHHMHLLNVEERAEAEGQAVERVLPLIQELTGKTVRFTENVMEYRFLKSRFIWDMDLAAFMSANIVREYQDIEMVAMGRTKTDIEDGSEDFFKRMERAQKLYEVTLSLEEGFEIPERVFPVLDLTKADIFAMLPSELRVLAWSCRQPVYLDDEPSVRCGACHTCQDLERMEAELENSH
ncbi:MAG: 7-cyano-7-deazaguanine synthase [Akkermansiaceae bacterium]